MSDDYNTPDHSSQHYAAQVGYGDEPLEPSPSPAPAATTLGQRFDEAVKTACAGYAGREGRIASALSPLRAEVEAEIARLERERHAARAALRQVQDSLAIASFCGRDAMLRVIRTALTPASSGAGKGGERGGMTADDRQYGRFLVDRAKAAMDLLFRGGAVPPNEQEQLNAIALAEGWLMSHADQLLAAAAPDQGDAATDRG